jgi:hypothetical protein
VPLVTFKIATILGSAAALAQESPSGTRPHATSAKPARNTGLAIGKRDDYNALASGKPRN